MNNDHQQWEKYQLKQKALKYYQENKVPQKMEHVLNLMFYEDPVDVFGYLANYFEAYTQPVTIHKLHAYTAWDSKGEPTLGIDIYCILKNKKKLLTSMISAGYDSQIWNQFKIKEIIEEKQKKLVSVEAAIGYINGSFGEQFHGQELLNSQQKTDAIIKDFFDALQKAAEEEKKKQEVAIEAKVDESGPSDVSGMEPDRSSTSKKGPSKKSAKATKTKVDITLPPNDPPYEWVVGSPAGSVLSQAMCMAEATVRDIFLFEQIASLATGNNQVPTSYRLPLLMVTMLHCGKLSAGKVNAFKEVLLIPNFHFTMKECVSHLLCIHDHLITILLDTYPKLVCNLNKVSDIGAITVQFDKPEQVLDLIIEAIEGAGFTPGKDFSIVIDCAADEVVDMEKGRYEFVTGINMKSMEDAVEFWMDLVTSYPTIVGLIDPLRRKEGKSLLQLCQYISSHCLIIEDCNSNCKEAKTPDQPESTFSPLSDDISQPTQEHNSEQVDIYVRSGQVFRLQQSTTVTDLINSVAEHNEAGTYSILSMCQGEGQEPFIADLAVGLRSRFLKTGGLSRGERFQVLNRLIHIEQILSEAGKVERDTTHWSFPKLLTEKSESVQQNPEF